MGDGWASGACLAPAETAAASAALLVVVGGGVCKGLAVVAREVEAVQGAAEAVAVSRPVMDVVTGRYNGMLTYPSQEAGPCWLAMAWGTCLNLTMLRHLSLSCTPRCDLCLGDEEVS